MKLNTIGNTFAIAVAALALATSPSAHAADKVCSNASLKGTFAYTNTGFLTAPPAQAGPFAGVGRQSFDGNGAISGTAWVSQNGNIFQITISGTYSVNPDCTGTFTLTVSIVNPPMTLPTGQSFVVIADDGAEFQAINTDPSGQVVTTVGRKQFSGWGR